ncbi:MAG: class I SAM-dependent methyltransferase [Candidatus Latescibacterota bacterium]|nr:MAG: class I SAM-dependent methyltransferase [Candidatus Latescibacterota bacterium]
MKRVKRDFSKEDWDTYYRRYQMTLAKDYLIPILSEWGVELEGKRFLEVGCGDGGCGAEFYRAGCNVVMMDIEERLVGIAKKLNQRESVDAAVYVGDILDEKAAFLEDGPFDLVMFRDVVEHLERPDEALRIVQRHLRVNGVVFVVFPPYYSPYGAHQQILPRSKMGFIPFNKLPYVQLLPSRWFLALTRGDTPANREVERLSRIRLTISRFEKCAKAAGFNVVKKRMFLSRPTFALRYGIPVIGSGVLGRIPGVNEVLVTGAYYLLAPTNDINR